MAVAARVRQHLDAMMLDALGGHRDGDAAQGEDDGRWSRLNRCARSVMGPAEARGGGVDNNCFGRDLEVVQGVVLSLSATDGMGFCNSITLPFLVLDSLSACARSSPPGNSLLAELLALKQGLELAWEKGHRRLIVETDSLEAIHLVNSPNNHNLYCGDVVRHIQQMLRKDWQIQCTHVMREANLIADYLAKLHNSGVDGVSVWHDPPLELDHDLALDKLA
ncbi:Ribonuclease H domain [Sesbania bispinosa]|nr:Ribonuclease H domain [Sesbania bispinosa]